MAILFEVKNGNELNYYTFSHCESASVQLRSADCIGIVSWDTTPTKVASYRHSAPL